MPRRLSPTSSATLALLRLRRWIPAGVASVLRVLAEHGGHPVLVGGAPRDAFLGRLPQDWDVASMLACTQVQKLFPRVLNVGERHGTVMVLTAEGPVEVTRFRGASGQDVVADLAGRDFTINAMAADMQHNALIDPFAGQRDLGRGLLRAVQDPVARLMEDPLRALRLVRLMAELNFRVHPDTRRALPTACARLKNVAVERQRNELQRLLRAPCLGPALNLLHRSGLLAILAPPLAAMVPPSPCLMRLRPDPWLRLAAWAWAVNVTGAEAQALLAHLRVGKAEQRRVHGWVQAAGALPAQPLFGAPLRHWAAARPALALGAAEMAQARSPVAFAHFSRRVRCVVRHACLTVQQLRIGGGDLRHLALAERDIGVTLQALLAATLDVPQRNRRAWLLHRAHKLSTDRL